MDFFDLFKSNTKSKPTRFNSDNRVSNMFNTTYRGQPMRWQPGSRTMKGRNLQQQRFDQSMNDPFVKLNNSVGDFISKTPGLSNIQNWMNESQYVGGKSLSDPGTYLRGNGDKVLAGILGGPLGSLALSAFDTINQAKYDTKTGGGQSGARVRGQTWYDIVADLIRRNIGGR